MSRADDRPMPPTDVEAQSWHEVAASYSLGDPRSLPWAVRVRPGVRDPDTVALMRTAPVLTYAVDEPDSAADLQLTADQVGGVLAALSARPLAVVTLAMLLRATEHATLTDAIHAESLAYSALQSGPEYAEWLASRSVSPHVAGESPNVTLVAELHRTCIVLDRHCAANAIDAQTRAELHSAFRTAALSGTAIEWAAEGRHFSAGGDLTEFGQTSSPAASHLVRMHQNLPLAIAAVARRLTVRVHGACIGAGMELSSFAHHVAASPDTRWRLPEVGMGLIPGCGGTVSIPRRIGRQRTLLLAVTGEAVDAETALDWGLVDEVVE